MTFTSEFIGIAAQIFTMLVGIGAMIVTLNVKLSQVSSRVDALTNRVNAIEVKSSQEIQDLRAEDLRLLERIITLIERNR